MGREVMNSNWAMGGGLEPSSSLELGSSTCLECLLSKGDRLSSGVFDLSSSTSLLTPLFFVTTVELSVGLLSLSTERLDLEPDLHRLDECQR
jgi:hypothetical protein